MRNQLNASIESPNKQFAKYFLHDDKGRETIDRIMTKPLFWRISFLGRKTVTKVPRQCIKIIAMIEGCPKHYECIQEEMYLDGPKQHSYWR